MRLSRSFDKLFLRQAVPSTSSGTTVIAFPQLGDMLCHIRVTVLRQAVPSTSSGTVIALQWIYDHGLCREPFLMGVRMHPFFFLSKERVHAGAPFLRLNPSCFFQLRGILTGLFLTEARFMRTSIHGFHDTRFAAGVQFD